MTQHIIVGGRIAEAGARNALLVVSSSTPIIQQWIVSLSFTTTSSG
jgi:hypothetical protein